MASRVSVRHKKPSLKKLESRGYGDSADGNDNITIMDMIRTFRKPTPQQRRPTQPVSEEEEEADEEKVSTFRNRTQQQKRPTQKRPTQPVSEEDEEETDEDKVRVVADVDSDEDEKVEQYFKRKRKRKRKSRGLYELLQCERPVSPLTPDLQDFGSPQLRKSKKSNEKKAHDSDFWGDGTLEVILGSSPPSISHALEKLAVSPVSNQADYTREMSPQCGRGIVRRLMREAWNRDGVKRMGAPPVLKEDDGAIRRQGDEKRGRVRRVVAQPLEYLETCKKQRTFSRKKVAGTSSDSHEQAAEDCAPAHFAPYLAWSTVPITFGEEDIAPQESDEDVFVQHVEVVVHETQDATVLELKEELSSQWNFVDEGVLQEVHDATALELREELSLLSHFVEEGVIQEAHEATALELREELSLLSHFVEEGVVQEVQHATALELREELSLLSHFVEEGVVQQSQDAKALELKDELCFQGHHVEDAMVQETQDATAQELKEELPSQSHCAVDGLVQQTEDAAVQELKEELSSPSHLVEEGVVQQSQEGTALEEELSSQSHDLEEDVVQQIQDAPEQILNEDLCSQSHHGEERVVGQAQDATEQVLKEELSSQSHCAEEGMVQQTQDATEQELKEELPSQSHYAEEGMVQQTQDAAAQELKEELSSQSHYVEDGVERKTQETTTLELEEELFSQRNYVEGVVQKSPDATAQEFQEELSSQSHYVEEGVVEQTQDSTAQELQEDLSHQSHLVEEGVVQQSQDATEKELEEEFFSDRLEDDDVKQAGHELPPSECDAGNESKENGGSLQGAGVGSPHSEKATTAGQMQDAALQSLEEGATAGPTAEIGSASGFPSPEEFVCSQRVDSACAAAFEKSVEGDSAEPVEENGELHQAHGIVEEVCNISSPEPNHPREDFVCSYRVDSAGAASFRKLEEEESAELLEEDSALGIVEEVCEFSSPGRNQPQEVFVCCQLVDSTAAAISEKLEEGKSAELLREDTTHGIMEDVSEFSSPGPNQSPEEFVCTQRVNSAGAGTFGELEGESAELVEDDVALHLANGIVEEACDFSSPEPIQPLEEFVCHLRVDSGDAATFEKPEEGDSAERVEDGVELHLAHGIVDEECGHLTASVYDGHDVAKVKASIHDSCEKSGEAVLDFPLILSQPRGRGAKEDCIEDAVNSVQDAPEAASSWSRSVSRASLKSKIIRLDGDIVASVTESSPPQSQGVESVLPECVFNSECEFYCGDVCDPPVGERRRTAVSEHPLPLGVVTVPLISDAEFEQIESFNYAALQEEWQNAGKFLNHIELSLFEEDAAAATPRKRKLCDPENFSDQVKRVAIEALLQQEVPFGRVQDTSLQSALGENAMEDEHIPTALSKAVIESNVEIRGAVQDTSPERVLEEDSMEDDHVPTALSKAAIERNGVRRGAVDRFPSPVDASPSVERRSSAYEEPDRAITREKRKAPLKEYPQSPNCEKPNPSPRCLAQSFDPLLDGEPSITDCPEPSPESNCDPIAMGESHVNIDLLASEKLGGEENSEDFEPPSKLPCRRKTISPLSQMALMRASDSTSQPANESPTQKIPAFRLKLTGGLSGRHEVTSPTECEPTPDCSYLEPCNQISKCDTDNDAVVSLDSSEDDTDDSSSRQGHGSGALGEEAARKFSLCLSPNSPAPSTSPESLTTDSSHNTTSLDPQSLNAASRGILITGARPCKGLCKCAGCSTSRSKAGTAVDFIASQMKTFQLIAGRLTMDIKSLRETIETNLPNPGETAKIQETLQKSRVVEEAAEKNLTNLLRDCKRYCKLTKTKPITMRKIVFADEAGKKLCHVKTFRSLPKSVLDLL